MLSLRKNEETKHLLVFVPENLPESANLAHRVHWMASRAAADVLLVTLVEDDNNRLAVDRALATLEALTRGDVVQVQSRALKLSGWQAAVEAMVRPGDTLVCLAGHSVPDGPFRMIPMSKALRDAFPTLPRISLGDSSTRLRQIKDFSVQVLWWLGCLAIIVLFSWLEFQAEHTFRGLARIGAIAMLLGLELGLVLAAGSISRQ